MSEQLQHDMLVERTHDEQCRQECIMTLRRHLASRIAPRCGDMYTDGIEAEFEAEHGHVPATRPEMRVAMRNSNLYQFFSAMQRTSQEMMWDSVVDSLERQLPELNAKARKFAEHPRHGGTLVLDPDLEIPKYLTGYDIHLQPGGYHADLGDSDVAAGALWDRAIYLYSMGYIGPEMDYWGRSLAAHHQKTWPDREPLRILDMGCTTGASTVPWKKVFPNAEVHGIDVGSALLRYGHARAESMGVGIHLSQQNAEHTDFDAASFDIVASGLLMHETSIKGVNRVFAESRRLLKPGGVMMHMDPPMFTEMTPLRAFLAAWEVYNVNEAFAGVYREMDLVGEAVKAGFAAGKTELSQVELVVAPKFRNYGTPINEWPAIIAHA
jgi:ubiquinone/menaquinone biosynthesis C-methylase UbiE